MGRHLMPENDYEGVSPCVAVVEAVAAERGTPPEHIRPLYEAIDPDALDTLLGRSQGDDVQVAFEHMGYRITADSTGGVSLDEVDE